MCLVSLHKIANYIFKKPLTSERELQLQKALGSFHVPVKPLCDETTKEFGDQVDDITRRFFHYMIRYESFEKAFSLAIDINDADLFMDLYRVAKSKGINDLADDALKKAEEIYKQIEEDEAASDGSHSTCSNSSCSICFSDDELEEQPHESDHSDDRDSRTEVDQGATTPKLYKSSSAEILNRPSISMTKTLERTLPHPKQYIPPLPQVARSNTAQKISIPKPSTKMTHSMSNLRINDRLEAKRFTEDKPNYSMDDLNYASQPKSKAEEPVLNVLPTPMTTPFKRFDTIDQTLGIPIAAPPFPRPYFQSPFGYPLDFSYRPVFTAPPVFHNHPLVAGKIPSMIPPSQPMSLPQTSSKMGETAALKISPKKEFNSILTNNNANSTNKKESGEKNKVKFSDTVQIAVVPEVPRKDKPMITIDKMKKFTGPTITDPEKELAESLPLCHPDDYLKDFNPLPGEFNR